MYYMYGNDSSIHISKDVLYLVFTTYSHTVPKQILHCKAFCEKDQ